MTVSMMLVVAGRARGYPKPVSEPHDNVTDAADDDADATVDTSPSAENIDTLVHEKTDMLMARSTVSGIWCISSFSVVTDH